MAEALRLAAELDQYLYSVPAHPLCTDAAAELRRLHELLEAEQALLQRVIYPELQRLRTQRDALLEALKTYGWHTEDCPQYPTHARPKNWPACTCGFDAAIALIEGRVKAVEGEKT